MAFLKQFKRYQDNIAFVTENNEQITYHKLSQNIQEVEKFKIPKNALVFLFASYSYTFNLFYLYFLDNKIIPFILNENLDEEKIRDLEAIYKPNYIILSKEMNLRNYTLSEKFHNYFIYKNSFQKKHTFSNDLALLMSTSGSTGDNKFVRLSKENILSNTNQICKYLQINKKDVAISSLPFSYSYGLSIINIHLNKGAKIIINKFSIIEKKFWERFQTYKVTSFSGVPYSFEILDKIKFLDKEYKYLKYLTIAGGGIDTNLLKKFLLYCKKKRKKLINMYGQTEATTRISYLPWHKLEKKIGSIGIPIPKGKLYLLDSKKKKISKPFRTGELVFKGKNVMLGYASSLKDLKLSRDNNFELITGDIGYKDKENFFYITGRKKRIVKIFGHRLSLDQIQYMLKKNGYSNACIGKKDKIIIFLENKFFEDKIKMLVMKYTKINLKNFLVLKKIKIIPMTSSGKINYRKLNKNEK